MKKLVLLLVTCYLLNACTRDDQGDFKLSKGTITGFSTEKCMCCWGWNVTINGKSWRFDKVPVITNLDLFNQTYPVKVTLKWKEEQGRCKGKIIEVTELLKQ